AERCGVAVAGTHGKSTTTAMISYALLKCAADPSFVIGGTVPQLGGGSRSGKSDLFIAEACEYDRSFHNLCAKVAVITNIEEDHLDCYRNIHEIVESFHAFAQLVPQDGLIIASAVDENVRKALEQIQTRVELCGLREDPVAHAGAERSAAPDHANWSTSITTIHNGCYRGEVFQNQQ